jgi:putative transposase
MTIKQEILDELLKEYSNPEDLMGKGGIFDELQKRLLETVMKAEMGNHLGYEKNSITGNNTGNSRNGKSKRTVKKKSTELELEVPRD